MPIPSASLTFTVAEVRDRWLESSRSELPWPAGELYLLRDLTEQRDLDRAKDLFFAATSAKSAKRK